MLDAMNVAIHARADGPLRIPMMEGYRDMGAVMGIGKGKLQKSPVKLI